VGAVAEEEQRGREEATIEHALDSILIAPRSSPFPSAVAAPPAFGGERETRRGRGFEGDEEREGGAGKATTTWETARASSGKKERGGRGAREDGAGSPVPGPYGGSGAFVDVILIRTVPCRHRRRWWTAALVRGAARAHQAGSWTEPRVPLPRGRAGEEVCGARRAYGAFATCHFVRPRTRHQGFHAKFISIFSTQNSVKMSS
jgi:hypothetical protein